MGVNIIIHTHNYKKKQLIKMFRDSGLDIFFKFIQSLKPQHLLPSYFHNITIPLVVS